LSLNFRGLLSKKESFLNIIYNVSPHFVAGTETWLNPSVYSSEVFPPCYELFRNDRSDGYGGVRFACHKSLAYVKISSCTTCEVLVCKIAISRGKDLIIVTFYRPPNTDVNYMQSICQVIEELYIRYKNAIIWITGDANLPHIDWANNLVTHASYSREIYNLFIDTLISGGFTQQVDSPTRGDNILDNFATNRPAITRSVLE